MEQLNSLIKDVNRLVLRLPINSNAIISKLHCLFMNVALSVGRSRDCQSTSCTTWRAQWLLWRVS
jgi:hypothetical protein